MPRVLIATDGSDAALHAARTGVALLRPGHIAVLSVVDVRTEVAATGTGLLGAEPLAMPLADPGAAAELDDALTDEARSSVERTAGALAADGVVDVDRLVAHGDPASEIVRAAEEGGFDAVVVGSHGSGFVKRVLVGSVSKHVVHHCHVPVLVVRFPQAGD